MRVRRWVEWGLWGSALAAASVLGWVQLDGAIHDRHQARQLRRLIASSSAENPSIALSKARPHLAEGALVGRLEIPRVGLSELVSHGTDALTLRRGVGHIPGSDLPGEPGNVGLAGHRDTVFRRLSEVEVGDLIVLVTAAGRFEYRVESLRTVGPERVEVLAPTAQPILTLVTCFPFDFIGRAPLRFIVRARQVGPWEHEKAPAVDRLRSRLRQGSR